MKIYLTARFSSAPAMRRVKADLERHGHIITSRWINSSHEINNYQTMAQKDNLASEDLCDITDADTLLAFTEEPRSTNGRGGRHVELGYALANNKQIIIIGPRENVFHYLRTIKWYPDYLSFLNDFNLPSFSLENE